jgi:hypothetical protein
VDTKTNPHEESHGDDCRCAYCSRELKDEASVSAGYGPVCAKNHDMPWGGSGREQAEDYTPSWERLTVLRRVCGPVLTAGKRALSWIRNTALSRVRAAYSRGRGSLYPWLQGVVSRMHGSQLAGSVGRYWSRTTPRTRRVALALCTVSAAFALVLGIRGWLGDETPADVPHRAASAVAAATRIQEVTPPILFHVGVGSAEVVCTASTGKRRQLAGAAATQIVPVIDHRSDQVVVLNIQDVPLSFSLLPESDQNQFRQEFGPGAPQRYESAVAALLHTIISNVESARPRAVLSVLGLPVEPEQAGVSIEIARQSNERYGRVIDRLGPFVPSRRFVVFGSTLDEKLLARMGMREALRLRDGRPIVFQTNTVWNALVDDQGLDYRDYLVALASGRIERHPGATRQGSRELEVQATLVDDPYWDP